MFVQFWTNIIAAIKMLLNKISNKSTLKVRENLFLVMWKAVLSPEHFMVGGDPGILSR